MPVGSLALRSQHRAASAAVQQVISTASASVTTSALAPLLGGAIFLVIVVNIGRSASISTRKASLLNFAALNPTLRLQQNLSASARGGLQLLMNLIKVTMVSLMAWSAINGRLPQIISVQQLSFLQIFGLAAQIIVFSIGIRVGILLLVLAILDYVLPAATASKNPSK